MSKEEYRLQPSVQPEAKPQGSLEQQPLPSVLDVLERRAQLLETVKSPHGQKHSRESRAFFKDLREKLSQLGNELSTLYAEGTNRDRLIIDVHNTLARTSFADPGNWRRGFSAEETRQFIDRVQPMSEYQLGEELRTAREALERKATRYQKMLETRWDDRSLTPEERREKKLKNMRQYQKENRAERNEYRRRYYRHDKTVRPNEKLREHQWQLALERMAKRREQEASEQSAHLAERQQEQHDAIQIFPSPSKK
jgi:hypothetical protein